MGRRRSRKQERKAGQRQGPTVWEPSYTSQVATQDTGFSMLDFDAFSSDGERAAPTKLCGNCTEFVEDTEGGRGTCLHPGSGILSPWTDTAACDFFARRRGNRG